MSIELRNKILGFKAAIPTKKIEGIGTIGCKTLSAGEFMRLRDYIRDEGTDDLDAMVRTFIMCACDPKTSEALFGESDAAGVAAHVPFSVLQDVTSWMSTVQVPSREEQAGN